MALLSLYAAYVVAMNVFLSTSLFQKVVGREPETIDIHFRRGWSLWPVKIHADDLSIRGRDSNIEWVLRIDDVDFDVDLLALAKMKFVVPQVHGRGIAMRIRSRLDAPPASEEEVRGLPPVDGLAPWSVRPTDVDHSDVWSDETYKLWTAHLERIQADDVRELWIDKVRFRGHADIQGRFFFKPIRVVDVGPTHVTVREGVVDVQEQRAAEAIGGSLDVTVRPLDPRVTKTGDFFHHLDFRSDARATLPEVDRFRAVMPEGLEASGAVHLPRIGLRIEAGILKDGTDLEVDAPALEVGFATHRAEAGLRLRAEVTPRGGVPELGARLDVHPLLLDARGPTQNGDVLVRVPDVQMVLDSRALDLASPFGDLHGVLDAPAMEIPHLARVAALLPKDAPIEHLEGAARAVMHLEGWRERPRLAGRVSLTADAVRAKAKDVDLDGALSASASVGSWSVDDGRLDDLAATLTLGQARIGRAGRPVAELTRATFVGKSASMRTSDPLARFVAWLDVPRARILARDPVLAITGKPSAVRLAQGHDVVRAHVHVAATEHRAAGTVELASEDLELGGARAGVRGAVHALARVRDWDIGGQHAVLEDAAIDVTNAALTRPGTPHPSPLGALHVRARTPRLDFDAPWRELQLEADAAIANAKVLSELMSEGSLFRVDAGRLAMTARLTTSEARGAASGFLDVALDRAALGFQETTLAGDFHLRTNLAGYDATNKAFGLEGTRLSMRNIQAHGATTETNFWNGDVTLDDARLKLAPYVELDGDMKLRADNARAFLAVLMREDLPKVLAGVAEMPNVRAEARVTVGTRQVAIRGFQAEGGDFRVHGLYGVRAEQKRAALIVEKGPVSAGVQLDDQGTSVRLFGLEGWLDEQRRAVVKLLDGPDAPGAAKAKR